MDNLPTLSKGQIERAEFLVEETLEIPPETPVSEVTIVEPDITAELKTATPVASKQLVPGLSSNVEATKISDSLVKEVSQIQSSNAIEGIRKKATSSFGESLDLGLPDSLDALPTVENTARIAPIAPACGIFSQGTAGDDLLVGTPCNDFFFAGNGDDIVIGLPGNDRIFGEAGNDFLIGGENDDVVDGGTGDDLIFGDDSRTPANEGGKDLIRGGAGRDVIFAGGKNDTVFGDNDDDVIYGESGRDILNGGDGNDLIDGGNNNDRLFGDSGNDLLQGGNGRDRINGEDGDDVAIGGRGRDVIFGGRGDDTISGVDATKNRPGFNEIDTLQGGSGSDLFQLGDEQDFYYDDGQILSPGNIPTGTGDYGLIEDFNIGEDLIQLNGSASQYTLQTTQDDSPFNQNNLPDGTAIYRLTGIIFDPFPLVEEKVTLGSSKESSLIIGEPIPIEPPALIELVGVVKDISPEQLDLSDTNQFTFV